MNSVKKSKILSNLRRFGFLLGTIFVFSLLIVIKIPFAFSNFWAEDGAFYQQALDNSFPRDFLISGGGYVIFISRILSNLVSLGPVEFAPVINAFVVITILGFIVQRLYINLDCLIKSRLYKIIVCLSVILLPINNVETIASGTALHFQLLFVSLVIALSARQRAVFFKTDILIFSIAILSDPFAVIALFPLILRRKEALFAFWKYKLGSAALLLISVLGQFIMVAIFRFRGNRELGESHSLIKTMYLFLDRVIGSTFIPNWGLVTSESLLEGRVTSQLIIRAVFGLICASLIAVFVLSHFRRKLAKDEPHSKNVILWLILLPTMYWFVAGFLFNPEPRYAVFPGLAILLAVFMLFDHLICEDISLIKARELSYFILVFVILIWALSASPSSRRTDGPSWHNEMIKARMACKNSQLNIFSVKILPTDDNWKIDFKCSSMT